MNKELFYNLKTEEELMKFMDKHIKYGWYDYDNKELKVDTLKGLREFYKINSLDDVFKNELGTCIEQAGVISEFYNNLNIKNHIYCSRLSTFNSDHVRLHCFVIAEKENEVIYFEHSNPYYKGFYNFEDLESAYNYAKGILANSSKRQVDEIDKIPYGYSFYEFVDYVNSFKNVKKK